MEIARPFLLFLLLLLPLLYYGHRRSLVDLGRWQRQISLALRSVIIILLILSLAGLQYLKTDDRLAVVFLADISDSMSEDELEEAQGFIDEAIEHRGNDRASVVVFTDTVQVIRDFADGNSTTPNREPKTLEAFNLAETRAEWLEADEGAGDATDIAQAIEMAWGIFPADTNRRIVLLSDGTETHGNGIRAGLRGKNFGVQLDTVPIYPSDVPEVVMKRLDVPVQVRQGEPFHLEVHIHSNHEDLAEIRLHKNKLEVAKREVRLKVGENRISFDQTATESGMLTFDASCLSMQDTRYDNNYALGIVVVSGTPKVLLIDENESQTRYLVRVLEDAGIEVNVRNGLGVPNELSDLQNYDLLLFSDVPANRLNQRQMEFIRTYVQDLGGGFMMLGSENSFGLGGYYKTPSEEILPVRTDTKKKKETPSIAMVLVIDKSGSMSGIKVELAKEAARATVELLGRRDKLGIIAFDGSPHWISEMHTAADNLYLSDQIGSIRAGGGTNLYPALQQAYLAP